MPRDPSSRPTTGTSSLTEGEILTLAAGALGEDPANAKAAAIIYMDKDGGLGIIGSLNVTDNLAMITLLTQALIRTTAQEIEDAR